MNDQAIISVDESRLLATARWHHDKANEAGRDGDTRSRDRHIAIRDAIRSQVYG